MWISIRKVGMDGWCASAGAGGIEGNTESPRSRWADRPLRTG
jgi:hypothetical protein